MNAIYSIVRCAGRWTRRRRALILAAVLALPGCGLQNPVWSEYEENTTGPAEARAPLTLRQPVVERPAALQWTAPASWKAQPGSSMRLGSFTVGEGSRTGLCTIIRLGGSAGGLQANIRRWIGQIGQPAPPPEELAAFIGRQERFQSEGGLDGVLIDLTKLGSQGPEDGSMLAALFDLGDMTVFVKFTGPLTLLNEERANFTGLCRTFRRGEE
jgi:hypothetical protein